MVSTNNLVLLMIASCFSNLILVRLMIHKSNWKAAKAAGLIAAKNYILSVIFMGSAFIIFYLCTGKISISTLVHENAQSTAMLCALLLLLVSAMMQSAIWPFHKWLLSSLNSPTPVSAMMHAGLVNGGGFILVRFAPLYLQHPKLLSTIFCIGLSTAVLGTLWKLMQNDVKRMLACSTMGQMGFMFAQCGLGLFPAAIAHLICHGMFKAYLFLSSSSAAQEKRLDLDYPPQYQALSYALICGLIGSFAFAYASGTSWITNNTTLVLMVIAFLSGTQFSLPILRMKSLKNFPAALILTIVAGLIYGSSVRLITWGMTPMLLMQPQALQSIHIIGMAILIVAWVSMLLFSNKLNKNHPKSWLLKMYVKNLNTSQPDPSTVTAYRNYYQYK